MSLRPAALLVVAAALGCASQGMPPGGPPDRVAPSLTRVQPESGAVGVSPRSVEFQFSEVVSERPRGAQSLQQLVVISPTDGGVQVGWNRDRLVVRPDKGWRENTAYTVTVLAGLSDLRSNFSPTAFRTVFSTGRTIPRGTLRGTAFDWMAGRPAPGARIEAMLPGDSTFRWAIAADSTGRFVLGTLPADTFLVRGWLDTNGNGLREPREPWDTVTVGIRDSARTDIYAFPHDTVGARISEITLTDSLTVRVKFDRGLRPAAPLDGASLRIVRARDSTEMAVSRILTAGAYDSLAAAREVSRQDSLSRADTSATARAARVTADSLRRVRLQDSLARAQLADLRTARDTLKREPRPVPSRPTPPTEFVLAMRDPLPVDTFRVIARDVQALVGPRRTSSRLIVRRPAPPRDTTANRRPPSTPPVAPPVVPPTRPPR